MARETAILKDLRNKFVVMKTKLVDCNDQNFISEGQKGMITIDKTSSSINDIIANFTNYIFKQIVTLTTKIHIDFKWELILPNLLIFNENNY